MLTSFRRHLKERTWPKWMLMVVVASFTMYLGAYYSCDEGGSVGDGEWAAKIDGTSIPAARYRAVARQMDQRYRQFLGANYAEIRAQFRLGTQALQQVVDQELILRDARALGLGVSTAELIDGIRTFPGLLDESGKFVGKDEYERRVRAIPGGVTAFEQSLASDLLVQKWTALVSQSVAVGDRELEELHRSRTEKTAIDYFMIGLTDGTYDVQITDEQARTWFDAHAERYVRDAGRKIRSVLVDRQSQLAQLQPTEDELRAHYASNLARFAHPDQRRASHILFRVEPDADSSARARARAEAEAVLERIRAGEGFATLARARSADTLSAERGGDLGWFGRGQMVAPFEEAAFSTEVDAIAPITESDFGVHVIQVTGARPQGTAPFEEVRDRVAQEARLRAAEERVTSEAARIREKIASAERFDAVAAEENLRIDRRFVSASEGLQELGLAPDVQATVLTLEPGTVSQPIRSSRGLLLIVVDEIVPAGLAPFDEVEGRVRGDVVDARSRDAALGAARDALGSGRDLRAAARIAGRPTESSGDLAPGQSLPAWGGDSPEIRRALFDVDVVVGSRGVAAVPSGAVVYEVTRRIPFDAAAFEAVKSTLRDEVRNRRQSSIVQSVIDRLRRQSEIVINEPLVRELDGRG